MPAAPAIDVGAAVRETARELVGSEVSADAPLMEAGLDSLGATEFQSRLSQRLGDDITLSDTLIFDFPTLRQIEAHVATLLPTAPAAAPTAAAGGILRASAAPRLTEAWRAACRLRLLRRQSTWALRCARLRRELVGSEVSADAPLMEAGLDSLGATEFQSRLSQQLGDDITLSDTLIFDFPTLRQIEAHVAALVPTSLAAAPTAAAGGIPPHLLQLLASQMAGAQLTTVPAAPVIDVGAAVRETARELFTSEVSADAPLMEAGLDSLGATEFQCRLSQKLGDDITLSETLIFDFPTLRQIEVHVAALVPTSLAAAPTAAAGGIPPHLLQLLASQMAGAQPTPAPLSVVQSASGEVCLALSGTSQLLPGGVAADRALWHLAAAARDSVAEVPVARWPSDAASRIGLADTFGRTRHGGFIAGAELFDNHAFSISPAEASASDPQQRLLLEFSHAALHQAGHAREALLGSGTGIALGICSTEFCSIIQQSPLKSSVYAMSTSLAIASGRISFALGLHGPCTSYETACSASLVACHSALRALRHKDCKLHLAAGVNLMLLLASSEALAIAGMTSKVGRSHTFDVRADGFARGEGCAIVALEPREDTVAVLVEGSAVRQDGRSASLTAPNGQAQQGLLCAALADAATSAKYLAVTEAHGTGTALGDPVEAGSLAGAVLSGQSALCPPVGVGSLKANIGHTEPTAGLAGLLKLVTGLARCGVPPNAQLRALNPYMRGVMIRGCGSMMPTQLAGARAAKLDTCGREQNVGGVSSFGYSGTIAYAVLSCVR